jgi:hypothetical protein
LVVMGPRLRGDDSGWLTPKILEHTGPAFAGTTEMTT